VDLGEQLTGLGRDAERGEVARARDERVDDFRARLVVEIRLFPLEDGHVLEQLRLVLEVDEQIGRERELVQVQAIRVAPDVREAAGIPVGKRLEQDAIDDAEDRGHRADAERERQGRDGHESRFLAEAAKRQSDVTQKRAHGMDVSSLHKDERCRGEVSR
jgi:hypothetical protein